MENGEFDGKVMDFARVSQRAKTAMKFQEKSMDFVGQRWKTTDNDGKRWTTEEKRWIFAAFLSAASDSIGIVGKVERRRGPTGSTFWQGHGQGSGSGKGGSANGTTYASGVHFMPPGFCTVCLTCARSCVFTKGKDRAPVEFRWEMPGFEAAAVDN